MAALAYRGDLVSVAQSGTGSGSILTFIRPPIYGTTLHAQYFPEFEQPLAELENKIEQLRYVQADSAVDISDEIGRLQQKSQTLAKEIYAKLTPWQTALVARHPQRPYTLDYVREIFTDFHELHGDRMYADDQSIIGGLARFNGMPCMVIGHQKGRDTRNAPRATSACPGRGLSQALRLMRLAEKFNLPVFTFVDTPGAYPGIGAEERGQSGPSATICTPWPS